MINDSVQFLRKVMIYHTISDKCHKCQQVSYPGFGSHNVDKYKFNHLIFDPILEKPICANCKLKMPMISETSACKKYRVQKEDIESLGLKFITTPCPYFKNKTMKLFYEFQIKKNLHVIRANHKQVRAQFKSWKDSETWEKLKHKR